MRKIATIYLRDWNGDKSRVTTERNPEAEWVFAGEGIATVKKDGTSCLVRDGVLYKRYELKPGKTAPEGFIPAQETDSETGKQPGWVPVGSGNEDIYHREAIAPDSPVNCGLLDGTYELMGPKIQGNPDRLERHILVRHGCEKIPCPPLDNLKAYFEEHAIEGIVWHHPDGKRMGKIKARDYGVKWPR